MNYLNLELCAQCGGKCCKRMPGETHPEDALRIGGGNLEDGVRRMFTDGYVIDWWEGDPRDIDIDSDEYVSQAYYLRPCAVNDSRPSLYQPSWGGACSFLTATGCKLEPEDRPYSCRMIEPRQDECVMHGDGGKQQMAVAWLPHNDLIDKITSELEEGR